VSKSKLIYVETTIPSFYYNNRKDDANLARQRWTQKWWDECVQKRNVVTSFAVIQELEDSGYPAEKRAKCLAMLQAVPLLAEIPEIQPIVKSYIAHKVMPKDPSGDALHLAIASFYGCEFLVTWNCYHLANPLKEGHIHRINDRLGLPTPIMTTPMNLLGELYEF
jgi:predicted nucleic acid-binding protein